MKVIGLVTVCLALGEGLLKLEQDNLYNFTIHKITRDIELEGIVKDKCASSAAEEAVNQFGSTFMFISDDHLHHNLLHLLQNNFVHSFYTEPDSLSSFNSQLFDNLVIFGNKIEVEKVIKKQPPQSTKFLSYVRNHQEAINVLEILWESRLVNAVVTYLNGTIAYFYTYFPYCSMHCGKVGKPYLLAQCDISNGIFSHREKLYPRKVDNLYKCPVSITFTQSVPFSYYTKTNELTGWEVELLNEILQRLNGVPKYTILRYKEKVYRRANGYQSLVENSEIGGGSVISLPGLTKTDFCMYGMSLCATWIVPRKDDIPSGEFLVKVFSPNVWLLVFITYIVLAVVITTCYKLKLGNVLFKLLPYVLNTSTRTRNISKKLGALWLLFGFIINAVYQSRFQSALVVPNVPKQLSTTEEILMSGLKIHGDKDLATETFPYLQNRFNLSRRIFRKNRGLSYESLAYRMSVRKDSAYFGFKEVVRYTTENTDLACKIYIHEGCKFKYFLGFVLKKNSHLKGPLLEYTNKLNENGFLSYFIRKHLSKNSRHHIAKHYKGFVKPLSSANCHTQAPIKLDKMSAVFMCFIAGISLALVAFLLELISKWNWCKLKSIISKESLSVWSYNNQYYLK